MFVCCVRETEISTAGIPLECHWSPPRVGIRMEPQLNTHPEMGTAVPFSSALTTGVTHLQLGSGL